MEGERIPGVLRAFEIVKLIKRLEPGSVGMVRFCACRTHLDIKGGHAPVVCPITYDNGNCLACKKDTMNIGSDCFTSLLRSVFKDHSVIEAADSIYPKFLLYLAFLQEKARVGDLYEYAEKAQGTTKEQLQAEAIGFVAGG